MTIGEQIQQLRNQNKMSQEELAEKLNVKKQSIMLWETNRVLPTLNELIGLRETFNIQTDYLLGNCETTTYKTNTKVIKNILLILFILSFFCLPFALFLVSKFMEDNEWTAMTEYMWLFYLPLPIPLTSVILGLKYKKKGLKTKKNIIAGIIFAVLLVIYGSFTFIFSGLYSHDFSYVNKIETKVNIKLPDSGNIITDDWTKGTQTTSDSTHYFYTSDVNFTNKNEISEFNASLKTSKLWITSISTPLSSILPSMYSYINIDNKFDYFMIYNIDLKKYNTIPTRSGRYRFVFLAYDSVHHKMKIGEYTFQVIYNSYIKFLTTEVNEYSVKFIDSKSRGQCSCFCLEGELCHIVNS